MNRLGFDARNVESAKSVYERLKVSTNVAQLTLMIHFANADRTAGASGPTEVAEQLDVLQSVAGGWPEPRSFANSAALFLRPEVKGDSVRPGIALYGAATDESHTAAQLGVEPAMTLKSRLIAVQTLKPGQAVGYGSRFAASRSMRIGVVACGYADGYPRNAPDGTPVHGRRRSGIDRRSRVNGHDHSRSDVGSAALQSAATSSCGATTFRSMKLQTCAERSAMN